MARQRQLLTIGHSYVVALNRRLADEMAIAGCDKWNVTAVAPRFVQGDLRPISLEHRAGERCAVEEVNAYCTQRIHVMHYGRRLRELLRRGWDLVHCWEEPYVLAGGQVASWTPNNTPFVFWTAQNIAKRYPPPFSWIEKYCLKRCAGWLACGESTSSTQIGRGYGSKPHRVIPLGVELEHFHPDSASRRRIHQQQGWSESGPPVVGFLGRFVAEKGLDLLMSALDQASAQLRALFVGGGPMEEALRAWAARHGDRVRVVTGVPHDNVPAYLNAMDVLCAPSQTLPRWREQLGRMLIEAFACGVPVIGSDSGEIPFVVSDAGIIVSEKDAAGWTKAIAELIDSPTRRDELVARGLDRARNVYAWPVIARAHLEFFAELL